MKTTRALLAILIIGGFLAVPVSCAMDSIQRAREDREFRQKYGPACERMNRAIKELHRLQAERDWERKQLERIKKEMPR